MTRQEHGNNVVSLSFLLGFHLSTLLTLNNSSTRQSHHGRTRGNC